jgi:hypothetical protein
LVYSFASCVSANTAGAGDLILVTVNAAGGTLALKKLWHKKKDN